VTFEGEIVCVDRLVDLWCLKSSAGNFNEIKELVKDFKLLVLDVTLEFCLDALKHGLNSIAVGVSYENKRCRLQFEKS